MVQLIQLITCLMFMPASRKKMAVDLLYMDSVPKDDWNACIMFQHLKKTNLYGLNVHHKEGHENAHTAPVSL